MIGKTGTIQMQAKSMARSNKNKGLIKQKQTKEYKESINLRAVSLI